MFLDEGVLQQESLDLGVGYNELQSPDCGHECSGLGAVILLLEVIGNPLLDISGFSNIDHIVLIVFEEVAAGEVWESVQGDQNSRNVFCGLMLCLQHLIASLLRRQGHTKGCIDFSW